MRFFTPARSSVRALGAAALAAALGACGLDLRGTGNFEAPDAGGHGGTGGSGGGSGGTGGGSSSGVDDASADGSAGDEGDSGSGSGSGSDSGSGSGSSSGGGSSDAAPDAPTIVAPPDFAWYLLDETNGVTAHDSTANHYDVQLQNVTWGLGATFGVPPGASPSGGFTTVAPGLRQAPVSFTAWLAPSSRRDETSNSYSITPFPPNAVSGDAAGEYGFGLGLNVWADGQPGSALAVEDVGYAFPNVGITEFMASTEYFVAATIGTSTALVYVDGQEVGEATPSAPGAAATTTLWLGLHNDDTAYGTKRYYLGRMRDVRVYKRVLSATDVATLYANGPAQ